METPKWKSRTKRELIVEVWEHLDCESVGEKELVAIEDAVREAFGSGAVDSPAIVARLVADEGAELRHAEVLELDVQRRVSDPYPTVRAKLLDLSTLAHASVSITRLEELRLQFQRDGDAEGVRRIRELALKARESAQRISSGARVDETKRIVREEIAEWLRVWLLQPELFDDWLDLRRRSKDFRSKFSQGERE